MRLEMIAMRVAGRHNPSVKAKVEAVEGLLKSLGVSDASLIANKLVRKQDLEEALQALEVQHDIPISDGILQGEGSIDLREVRRHVDADDLDALRNMGITDPEIEEYARKLAVGIGKVFQDEPDWDKVAQAVRLLADRSRAA